MVALDEELKETATLGEAATFNHWVPLTRAVDAPVLSLMPDHDFFFCLQVCEPGGPEATLEPLFWGPATCFEVEVLPEAGHFLQLHPGAAAASNHLVQDWLARRVGVDAAHGPSGLCTA